MQRIAPKSNMSGHEKAPRRQGFRRTQKFCEQGDSNRRGRKQIVFHPARETPLMALAREATE
jgi:hypothetical protein